LDNSYLCMDEDRLRKEYMKAADDFTFLQDRKLDRESKQRVEELQAELNKLKTQRAMSPETIREEVRTILREQGSKLLKELTKEN